MHLELMLLDVLIQLLEILGNQMYSYQTKKIFNILNRFSNTSFGSKMSEKSYS